MGKELACQDSTADVQLPVVGGQASDSVQAATFATSELTRADVDSGDASIGACPKSTVDLRSVPGGEEASIIFLNRTPFPVRLFSIDALGGEVRQTVSSSIAMYPFASKDEFSINACHLGTIVNDWNQ